MAVRAVDADPDNLRPDRRKVVDDGVEPGDLRRADKREVVGVEEEDDVLSYSSQPPIMPTSVILEIHGGNVVVNNGGSLEQGRRLSHEGLRGTVLHSQHSPIHVR